MRCGGLCSQSVRYRGRLYIYLARILPDHHKVLMNEALGSVLLGHPQSEGRSACTLPIGRPFVHLHRRDNRRPDHKIGADGRGFFRSNGESLPQVHGLQAIESRQLQRASHCLCIVFPKPLVYMELSMRQCTTISESCSAGRYMKGAPMTLAGRGFGREFSKQKTAAGCSVTFT
jgi:hypothetical protein